MAARLKSDASPADSSRVEFESLSEPARLPVEDAIGSLRVLIVDDDELDRLLVRSHLGETAWELVEAETLEDALECATVESLGCAVIDYHLPDGTGCRLAAELHARLGEDFPVVMLTGQQDERVAMQMLEQGVQDYLCKGELGPGQLARSVRHAVRRQNRAEQRRRVTASKRIGAVGSLAAGTAHEINNPAAFVLANLEVLDTLLARIGDEPLKPGERALVRGECHDIIRECVEGVHRISEVVGRLDRLAHRRLRLAPVDLEQVVVGALARVGSLLDVTTVVQEVEADVPLVIGDDTALQSALEHLLANAAQAIVDLGRDAPLPNTRRHVRVTLRRAREEISLTVTDDGIGMDADLVRRAREPFVTTRPGVARGLGLALVEEVITAHGGRVDIRSEPRQGSAVEIRLPPDGALHSEPTFPLSGPRPRVTLVDADGRRRAAWARLLQQSCSVNTARPEAPLTGIDADALVWAGPAPDAARLPDSLRERTIFLDADGGGASWDLSAMQAALAGLLYATDGM
jgi:signal transduction histidine kinase